MAIAARILCAVVMMTVSLAGAAQSEQLSTFDPVERAGHHAIEYNRPAIDFFEGAVLGNGGLGVVVCTRPDAVVLYFGHNDVWDIRLAEDNKDKIGTFAEVFAKVDAVPDNVESLTDLKWFSDYLEMLDDNYRKPYPRPFPCGSIVLWFDRRRAEMLGHRVAIDTGICTIDMTVDGAPCKVEIFTGMQADTLWLRTVDAKGTPVPSPFVYMTLRPDPATPPELPAFTTSVDAGLGRLSFRQILPFSELSKREEYKPHPKDKAFSLTAQANVPFKTSGMTADRKNMGLGIIPAGASTNEPKGAFDTSKPLVLRVELECGPASSVGATPKQRQTPDMNSLTSARNASGAQWREFWSKSGVVLPDTVLERTWYRNLYFLRCSVRPGVTCPGLFANWSFRNIGTAWHGDYHMNYNTQQPFWVTFSSNHTDLHLPYVDMVERTLLPVSKIWAKEYYGMRGAFFPHSAYPVEMTIMPYPLPTWGWEVFETPWSVQSLWWHYLYTKDEAFLKDRAFGVMKEAVLFLVDYMKRPEAHGGPRWNDDKYHIFPSVPPELYGLMPGFKKNYDTQADLALTRFVFDAWLESCRVLACEQAERELIADVKDILAHFPEYPTAQSSRGEVFVSVPGEDPEVVYNCPASLMSVFPGEQHGLFSPKGEFDLAVRTFRNQQNEGGNDLIFLNIQAARLGILDLDRFSRQIEYCLLPNGTCTDKVLQIHGRYTNNTPYDFMAPMGMWFENFALPVVVNECLLQSYNGELRFFPNWPEGREAEFRTLRAAGAFLVSAKKSKNGVDWIEIESEKGGPLSVVSPWKDGADVERAGTHKVYGERMIVIDTKAGETIVLKPSR